jgi:glycosyltransferase involved in cell wall biosynthesis
MLYSDEPPASALPYKHSSICFVPLKPLGGESWFDKLKIILAAPSVVKTVNQIIKKTDCFQLRAPMGLGVFLIPYLSLFSKKQGWFKYAGNWNQKNPPIGYSIQRSLLKLQSRVVTINGSWQGQPQHCLSFENPCLTKVDLEVGSKLGKEKSIEKELVFCFVGRLEKPKGVEVIIQAIESLDIEEQERISAVHLVGDGPNRNYFKSMTKKSNVNYVFHGALSREQVFDIYKVSHAFLLPTSASEGFPKVIAEAMNFGCLPVVSNISAIGQYVEHLKTGFVLKEVTSNNLSLAIRDVMVMKNNVFHSILINQRLVVKNFSFEHYNHRIKTEIFSC